MLSLGFRWLKLCNTEFTQEINFSLLMESRINPLYYSDLPSDYFFNNRYLAW